MKAEHEKTIEKIEALPMGTVIKGKLGLWTFLGNPRFSHWSTFDGSPQFRVSALYEGKCGTRAAELTFDSGDIQG